MTSWFLDQGSNLLPLQQRHRIVTTGPPGKSLLCPCCMPGQFLSAFPLFVTVCSRFILIFLLPQPWNQPFPKESLGSFYWKRKDLCFPIKGIIPVTISSQKKLVSSPPRNSPDWSNWNEWASISSHSGGPAVVMPCTCFGKKAPEGSGAQCDRSVSEPKEGSPSPLLITASR